MLATSCRSLLASRRSALFAASLAPLSVHAVASVPQGLDGVPAVTGTNSIISSISVAAAGVNLSPKRKLAALASGLAVQPSSSSAPSKSSASSKQFWDFGEKRDISRTVSNALNTTTSGSNPFGPLLATGKITSLDHDYEILEELGSGRFGVVRRVRNRRNNREYAAKTIAKTRLQSLQEIKTELVVHKRLEKQHHPNIGRLVEVFENRANIHLVSELFTGGELFDRIIAKGVFSEPEAAHLMKQILEALCFLHKNGVVHRDVKPENLLFSSPDPGARLVLVDFGLSGLFDPNSNEKKRFRLQCGSPTYVSPDVLNKNYTEKTDLWSAGVILYILLSGSAPFHGKTDTETMNQVCRGVYNLDCPRWNGVSVEAKQLIRGLLEMDPEKRLSAQEALSSNWILNLGKTNKEVRSLKALIPESP